MIIPFKVYMVHPIQTWHAFEPQIIAISMMWAPWLTDGPCAVFVCAF